VVGAGSWGTTLANLLAEKGLRVHLWVREPEVYEDLQRDRINHTFLPGVRLSARLAFSREFPAVLKRGVVSGFPPVFREVRALKPFFPARFWRRRYGGRFHTAMEVARELSQVAAFFPFSFARNRPKQPTAVISPPPAVAQYLQKLCSLYSSLRSRDVTGWNWGRPGEHLAISAAGRHGLGITRALDRPRTGQNRAAWVASVQS
jgi:hypothetical protein